MAHSKISITVPEEILREIKELAAKKEIKVSRLISEALDEKVKKMKEEAFVSRINKLYKDPEISKEQQQMAEDIAKYSDIEELPW